MRTAMKPICSTVGKFLSAPFFLALAIVFSLGFLPSRANSMPIDDRNMVDPTAWIWYYNITESQVNTYANTGYRITAIDIVPGSTPYFDVAMVQNTGAYQQPWWWYTGVNATSLQTLLNNNQARLIDLRPYEGAGGQTLFAAVMVENSGSKNTSWWWYYGETVASLFQSAADNNARFIDFQSYKLQGITYYSGAMVDNAVTAKDWWAYSNATSVDIQNYLIEHDARLYSISSSADAANRYDVIMIKNTEGYNWWWYTNIDATGIDNALSTNNARLINIDDANSSHSRFNVIMIDNAPARQPVPEPAAMLMSCAGIVGLMMARRKKKASCSSLLHGIDAGGQEKYGANGRKNS
jgi:hypothetical protein